MRFARFSLAGLLGAIVVFAVGMACLMFASTAWAGVVWSVTLGFLTLAPLVILYRRGERRAFWTGVVLCGWAYMALTSGPWFIDHIRPRLVTSRLLRWAYPWLIPADRQSANPRFEKRPFYLPPVAFEGGLTIEDLNRGALVDVWVKADGGAGPALLVEGVRAEDPGGGNAISVPSLTADGDQFAKLSQAKAYNQSFILRPHRPGPLDPLWSSPPVSPLEFEDVGHPLFGLLCAWIGGMVGRYFFVTRGLETAGGAGERRTDGDGPDPVRPD
jgi:hypothetical protein